jgi:hypothetical protein
LFQTFEHNGRVLHVSSYGPDSARPAKTWPPSAPGTGVVEIGRIVLEEGIKGSTLTTQVRGRNIAHIFAEILLKDRDLDRYYGPVVREHVRAHRNKETGGVIRPDWDDPVDVVVAIHPILRLLTDGIDSAFCFSVPEGYGSSDYRIDGLYALADGAAPFRARFAFDSAGEMKRVIAYKEQGGRSTPHALNPGQGDRFAPFVQVLTPPTEDGDWEVTPALSTPLAFHDKELCVVTDTPMPGEYLVGLLVQDLDGRLTRKYVPLTIGDGWRP